MRILSEAVYPGQGLGFWHHFWRPARRLRYSLAGIASGPRPAGVTSGPKVHNPGGLKVHTSTSLASNLKGCGDVARRRVPHVKRSLQTGIEHQRDRPSNGLQSQDSKQIRERQSILLCRRPIITISFPYYWPDLCQKIGQSAILPQNSA